MFQDSFELPVSPRRSLNSWKLFSFCFFEGLGSRKLPIYQDQKEILSLRWTEIFLWWNCSALSSYVWACELDYSWALCMSVGIPTPHSDGGLSIWSLWLEDVDQQCGGYLPETHLMSFFYAVLISNPIVGSHCLGDTVNRFCELSWDTMLLLPFLSRWPDARSACQEEVQHFGGKRQQIAWACWPPA